MKRKRFTKDVIIFFVIIAAAYTWHLRLKPNKHYAQVFYQKGTNCEREGCSLEKQVHFAKKVIHYDPDFSLGYTRLGVLYEKTSRKKQAHQLHQKAVTLDNQNWISLQHEGIYYFRKGEVDKALKYLTDSYAIAWYGSDINYYLGRIYERKGNYHKALQYYSRCYQANTSHLNALARMGAMEFNLGDVKKVDTFAQRIRGEGNSELASLLENYAQVGRIEEFRPDED